MRLGDALEAFPKAELPQYARIRPLQDVIEHVEEPTELLDRIISLTKPGGTICIGSPNADQLDLGQLDKCVHSLHQPYHLHILSAQALRAMAGERGLTVKKFYDVVTLRHCCSR